MIGSATLDRAFPGWSRIDPDRRGKLEAKYEHESGWRVEHCGHPTANHPYAVFDPAGHMHTTGGRPPIHDPGLGYAWNDLATAFAYVAWRLAWERANPRGAELVAFLRYGSPP